jgi:hypothetical protein
LTDPPERRFAVDQRPHPVSFPNRIATGFGEGNVLSPSVHLRPLSTA